MAKAVRDGLKVLCVASGKGGAGKSTLASALAVEAAGSGIVTAVIDLDPQRTLDRFFELRGRQEVDAGRLRPVGSVGTLAGTVERLRSERVELVVIDTPPALFGIIEKAIEVSDLVVVPVQASAFDIEGALRARVDGVERDSPVVELVKRAGKTLVFVINRVEPDSRLTAQAVKRLRKDGNVVLREQVSNREVFRVAPIRGRAGQELGDEQAKREIKALWKVIGRMLMGGPKKAGAK